jgi:hypothetical protein
VVLALLQPDGNAAGDLGATLLAAHRAGAAACGIVSKGAVPSEMGLVSTLGSARAAVAGLVVDAAAHSMEAGYAGLFVRDFFDDAEQGALHVYRTAVSKGVSPSVAASRAAAVFGVPGKEMGRYVSLAIDPKTNPLILTDAADRALLTFVSKTVELEVANTDVAKAALAAAREPDYEYEEEDHPRTADGRWTNAPDRPRAIPGAVVQPNILAQLREWKGMGGQAAPSNVAGVHQEADPEQPKEQSGRSARAGRIRRTNRSKEQRARVAAANKARVVRAKEAEAKAAASRSEGFVTEPVARTPVKRRAVARRSATRVAAARAASVKEYRKKNPEAPPAPSEPDDPNADNALRMSHTGYGHYDELPDPRVFYTSADDETHIRTRMPGRQDVRLFRMYELKRAAMDADWSTADDDPTSNAVGVREHMARAAHLAVYGDTEIPEEDQPLVQSYDDEDIYHAASEEELQESIAESMAEGPDGNIDYNELINIERNKLQDYSDDSISLVVHVRRDVWNEQNRDRPRPKPTIGEFFITHGVRARVSSDESGERGAGNAGAEAVYDYDPDQMYKSTPVGRYYDQKRSVFVNSYEIEPVSEEEAAQIQASTGLGRGSLDEFKPFKKSALALAPIDRLHFNQEHPRDDEGQFADKSRRLTLVSPSAAAGGAGKTPRQMRASRQRRGQDLRSKQSKMRAAVSARNQREAAAVADREMFLFDTTLGTVTSREPVLRSPVARSRPERIKAVRAAVARRLREEPPDAERTHNEPAVHNVLDDYSDYKVMTQKQFNAIVDGQVAGQIIGYDPARLKNGRLHSGAATELLEMNTYSSDEALTAMKRLIQQQAEANGLDDLGTIKTRIGPNEGEDDIKLAGMIKKIKHQHPDMSYFKMVAMDEDHHLLPGEEDFITWKLKGNATKPIDPLVIIQMQRNIPVNIDRPLSLEWQNKYKLVDIASTRDAVDIDDESGWSAQDSHNDVRHYRALYQQYSMENPLYSKD